MYLGDKLCCYHANVVQELTKHLIDNSNLLPTKNNNLKEKESVDQNKFACTRTN